MRIGAFGWTGSYARKGNWTETVGDPTSSVTPGATTTIDHKNEVRKLSQNRYAFSFEYKANDWTVRSEYIHSTGMAFAKSITNHGDAASKDCSLNQKIGNKAQGVYGLVIAPIVSKKLYAKARYDMYEANGKTDMMRTQYEVGLNYHINKNFTILSEYAFVNDRTSADHNYSMADVEVCFRF